MAATNYTPIQLYYSTTASAAPAAGNLVNGELAINITDGKLYYKDNGGNVQVIATKGAGTIGGSNTQIQFNDGGALAGNAAMVFNKATNVTTLTTLNLTNALGATYGGTAQSAYAQGDLLYASAVNTLSKLSIGTVNYILTSTGSVPQWVAPTSVTVQTANNLAGGAAGSVPYQSAADTTTFLAIGAANRVMTSTGSAPQWVTSLTGLTGVSSSSITNTGLTSGRVVYSGASGVQTDSANLTFNGTTLSAGGFSTTGNSTLVKLVTIGDSSFTTGAVLAAATPAKLYIGTGAVTDGTSAGGATNTLGTITAFGQTQVIATNANVTYTNLATLYIAGAPTAGTNVTITNPYSLYVAAGASYFGGGVTYGGNLTVTGNLQVDGNTTLGNASGDSLTTNTGAWTINNDITINTNLMYWDRANNRVGFGGVTSPAFAIHSGAGGLFSGVTATSATPTYAGVSIGFNGTGNIGIIASTNPSSAALILQTKKDSTTAPLQRLYINELGVIYFQNTGSESSGTTLTIDATNVTSSLNVIPSGNVVQNLGGASNRWANVFASTLTDGTNAVMVSSSGTNMYLAAGSSWNSTIIYAGGSQKVFINSNGIGVGAASSATDLLLTDGTSTLTIDAAASSEILANGSTGLTLNASNASGQIFFRTAGAQRGQVSPSGQWTVGGVVSNPATSANLIVNNGTTGASTTGAHVIALGNINNTVGSERGAGVYIFAQNAATGGADQASILFGHRNNAGTGEGSFAGIRSYKDSGADTSSLNFYYGNAPGSDAYAGSLFGSGRWGFGSSINRTISDAVGTNVAIYGSLTVGQLSPFTRFTSISTVGVPTFRYDDNGYGSIYLQNLGITGTGQGHAITAQFSTDGTNNYAGGSIQFTTVGAYSGTASTQDSQIDFYVAVDGSNTKRWTIANNGNLVSQTADAGIDFGINSAASGATSEVLNDYEEGTWTPTILYGGSDSGQTYAIQVGRYVKVGSVVHAQGYAQVATATSATGTLSMGGLPFASANVSNYISVCAVQIDNASSAIDQPVGNMANNVTNVVIVAGTGANNATGLTDSVRGASFRVVINISYRVN